MANRPPRLRDFDYLGFHRYHVRIGTWDQARHFASPAITCATRSQMFHAAKATAVAVRAYCFMPDHAHVLVQGTSPAADLRGFVARWKQHSAHVVSFRHRLRLWRTGYYDRVLRETEGDAVVARYIVANPVRAGLAAGIGEYPFAWCEWGNELLQDDD